MTPPRGGALLECVRNVLGEGGGSLLLGTGLLQPPEVPGPACDDAAGVNAESNRDVLHVLGA